MKSAPDKRRLAPIFGSDEREERFWELVDHPDPSHTIYVYRAREGVLIKPYIFRDFMFPDVVQYIRDRFGGGEYGVIIRDGRSIKIAGTIAIGVPLNWRQPKWR